VPELGDKQSETRIASFVIGRRSDRKKVVILLTGLSETAREVWDPGGENGRNEEGF